MFENPARRACGSCSREPGRARGLLVWLALVGLVAAAPWGWQAGADDGRFASGTEDTCASFDQDHAAWTGVLQRTVRGGVVDYAGLKRSGEAELNAYASTRSNPPSTSGASTPRWLASGRTSRSLPMTRWTSWSPTAC